MKFFIGAMSLILTVTLAAGTLAYLTYAPLIHYGKTYKDDLPVEVVDYYLSSVYRIMIDGHKVGTAFYIDDGRFLTNCHLVREDSGSMGRDITLGNFDSSNVIQADSAKCAEQDDLAIVYFSKGTVPGAQELLRYTGKVYVGKTVFAGGYGSGQSLGISRGHIQPDSPYYSDILHSSVNTVSGDSGSPVVSFFDDQLYIVGISAQVQAINFLTFFGPEQVPIPHRSMGILSTIISLFLRDLDKPLQSVSEEKLTHE